jgi:hypothetical protein
MNKGTRKVTASDIPAGWFEADVPNVSENSEGWYWAWRVSDTLDVHGNLISERKPEVVLVEGAKDSCDRRIWVAGSPNCNSPGDYVAVPGRRVLWKGPLFCQ